jgi:hypothetical protein
LTAANGGGGSGSVSAGVAVITSARHRSSMTLQRLGR